MIKVIDKFEIMKRIKEKRIKNFKNRGGNNGSK